MNDLERVYFDAAFAGAYPEFVASEREEKKPKAAKPQGSRERAKETAPGVADAGTALMDMLAGALKGSVAQVLGLPGDVESLYHLIADGQQKMLTTNDIQKLLPPVVPSGGEPRARVAREKTAHVAEEAGTFLPVAPLGVIKAGVTAAKRIKFDAAGKRIAAPAAAVAAGDTEKDDAVRGELGTLKRPDGGVSTELSITENIDGKWVNIPLLVKGQKNVEALLADEPPTDEQIEIAIERARARVKSGASLPTYSSLQEAEAAARARPTKSKVPYERR